MLEMLVRKQFSPAAVRHFSSSLKVSYCDSSLIKPETKLKSLVESDFSRAVKRPFKKNFIENLFVKKFQAEVLQYPELDTIEEVERLTKYSNFAEKLITDETPNESALCNVNFKEAVSTLKKHELAGFKIPRVKNGFGFLSCEYSRVQEALGVNPSLSKTVCQNEDFGVQLIDIFGNETQKELYLRKLISGESIASFAHLESGNLISFEEKSLNASAVLSSDKQSYIISGTKTWVYNAKYADLFILSANIKSSKEGKEVSKPTLFLVSRNSPGLVIHEPIKKLGMKNLNICDITLNEVIVPSSHILGNVNEGGEIIKKILCRGKLNNGAQCLAIMRKLVNKCIKHCIHNEFFNKDKYETDYFRIKIGQMTSIIYVVESMTYLLTGRFDLHTDADVFLESLIVKVFASESLQFVIKGAMEILGNEFFTSDENLNELVKDSQFYIACDDTNYNLRVVLASVGLKYAMNYRAHPIHKLSNFLTKFKSKALNFDLVFENYLKGFLHLMFEKESKILEHNVHVLGGCTQYLLKTFGEDVFHKYLELTYLADIVINIYAMTATLGRASRAYCFAVSFCEVDRLSAEMAVQMLHFQNNRTEKLINNCNAFDGFSQINSSIMNSNKYSDLYSVVKNSKNQNNRVVMKK